MGFYQGLGSDFFDLPVAEVMDSLVNINHFTKDFRCGILSNKLQIVSKLFSNMQTSVKFLY